MRSAIALVEDAPGRTFQVFILSAPHGPEECEEPEAAENQCDRNEIDQRVHSPLPDGCSGAMRSRRPIVFGDAVPASRNALATTISDELDIAIAATRGVA